MQIFVNDSELEAKLTDEENLGQVYESVSDWIRSHNRYVLGVSVDNLDVAPETLGQFSPARVSRIDFRVGDEVQMMAESAQELDDYVDRIGHALFDRTHLTEQEISNLRDGTKWIVQIIETSCGILRLKPEEILCPVVGPEEAGAVSVKELLTALSEAASALREDASESILVYLTVMRDLRFFILKLKMQLLTMNASLEDLLAVLDNFETKADDLNDEIIEINKLFQSGQDFQALEQLDRMIERLNGFLSAAFALEYRVLQDSGSALPSVQIEGRGFQEAASDVTGVLKDLSSAMEEKDIVAVGDILEYELTEKLASLREILGAVRSCLPKS